MGPNESPELSPGGGNPILALQVLWIGFYTRFYGGGHWYANYLSNLGNDYVKPQPTIASGSTVAQMIRQDALSPGLPCGTSSFLYNQSYSNFNLLCTPYIIEKVKIIL